MQRIFLIGYMGCGKTVLGEQIAARFGIGFVDIDRAIEAKYNKTVSEIFLEFGQEHFRKIERNALLEIVDFEDVLIATGGGTPCFFDNMDLMNRCGETIYIRLTPEELAARLTAANTVKRPLLQGKTGVELIKFIKDALTEREKFYLQAKYTVNGTDKDTVDKTIQKLITENEGKDNKPPNPHRRNNKGLMNIITNNEMSEVEAVSKVYLNADNADNTDCR